MEKIRINVFRGLYFFLASSGLPAFVGYLLLQNALLAIEIYCITMALSIVLSMLPGRIGPGKRIPFRVAIAGIVAALGTVGLVWSYQTFWIRTLAYGLLCGGLMLFGIKEICAEFPVWIGQHGSIIGIVLYIVPGIAEHFMEVPVLHTYLWGASLAFLLTTAFFLNRLNQLAGLATRKNGRPPKSMTNGNRVITSVLVIIGAIAVFWNELRSTISNAALAAFQWILRAILWFMSLFGGTANSSGGGGGGGASDLAGLGEAETSMFWVIAEKIMLVAAVLVGTALLIFALYYIGKLLVKLIKRLIAYMNRFADQASEDFVDEQETLLDLDDIKEKTRERFSRAMEHLTRREPRWSSMTPQEKVRYCVRMLYRRAPGKGTALADKTFREAAEQLLPADVQQEGTVSLYEQARYSQREIRDADAEELRKAVKF